MKDGVTASAPARVVRSLRPVVWLLAVGWLALQSAGNALGRFLDGYDRAANAAGRAVARLGRALLRALGPLGRVLRRLAMPVLRVLRRLWDALGVRLLLRMFRPLGRWARAAWHRLHPLVERLQSLALRLAARLEPVLRALVAVTDAVEAAAARVGARCRRAWAPVARAVLDLRRRAAPDPGARPGVHGCGDLPHVLSGHDRHIPTEGLAPSRDGVSGRRPLGALA